MKSTLKKFLNGKIDLVNSNNSHCLCAAAKVFEIDECSLEEDDGCWWWSVLDDGTAINFFLDDSLIN
jgi:hypothetical protein